MGGASELTGPDLTQGVATTELGDGKMVLGTTVGLDGKVRPDRLYDTTERDNQIRELRASGKSMREIAAEVQCSVGTVHRILAGSFR